MEHRQHTHAEQAILTTTRKLKASAATTTLKIEIKEHQHEHGSLCLCAYFLLAPDEVTYGTPGQTMVFGPVTI